MLTRVVVITSLLLRAGSIFISDCFSQGSNTVFTTLRVKARGTRNAASSEYAKLL